jgi:2,4-dienoyl-CoA reductase-like NADH-dependent reductase (Old Yellow Enzyme family)
MNVDTPRVTAIEAAAPTAVQRASRGKARFPMALTPLTLRGVTLPNRLFFAPMGVDLAAHDGSFSPALETFLQGMVDGGCAAVILSNATVSKDSILQPKGLKMLEDKHAAALGPFISKARAQGVVVGVQLQHYGGQGTTTYTRGQALLTPSGVEAKSLRKLDPRYRTREMSLLDIQQVQDQFAQAARRCRDAGAQLVQLQASNGYLLSSFLSKHTNLRTDAYGGSDIARARMLIETVHAVRQAIGPEILLSVRLGIDDMMGEEGQLPEHLAEAIPAIEAAGADLIEASVCVADTFSKLSARTPEMLTYLKQQLSKVKSYATVPLGYAGFIDSLSMAEEWLRDGSLDMVGMARALFADNDLILKTVESREDEIHHCLWDGKCFKDKYNPRFDRVYCCVNPKYMRPN